MSHLGVPREPPFQFPAVYQFLMLLSPSIQIVCVLVYDLLEYHRCHIQRGMS